ncbi:TatD family hydrolase [Lutimonas saemankumensis]|uniref:TatD family hydrolase n=1 Tax=Lutimonas saemankumensis TaxID=483016 RepID=UPI001CD5A586|nr:TatD family hydrolase [Lutimonas saemankumensis]MCA0931142.1 TatD family hydrolase [Lutimonas saemankumensis]
MMLTDTHTHLYVEQFDEDRREIVEKAIALGIERFFIPAIDASYYPRMYELERSFPENIFLMAGLHPTHVNKDYLQELSEVEKQLDNHKFYAIGEIGMDLYWDKTFLEEQKEAFKVQISWAKKRNLPIAIHCREAFDEIFEVMDQVNDEDLNGIFHCFTGNREQADKVLSYGFKLGIGGVVTFKNGGLDKFIGEIPLEHIVLETDSPYLAPSPFRGKRNESAYLIHILDKLADIYGCSPEIIAKITTKNSQELFGV